MNIDTNDSFFNQENDDKAQSTATFHAPTSNMSPTSSSSAKELQQMRESLEQQTLQTRQALAQLVMLRDQLITETNARIEAQVIWIGIRRFYFSVLTPNLRYVVRLERSNCYNRIAS